MIKEVDGVNTVFHYDFDGLLIGESGSNGIFTTEYLYQTGKLLAKVDVPGNTVYHYLNDYLGSPKALTDDTNKAVWEATYLPFGKAVVNPASSVVNNMRFPGQYYDQETELHWNRHRYYDPSTGRYLTTDPIGLAGGINLYAYVLNNPINFVDPTGEFATVVGGMIGGGIAGGIAGGFVGAVSSYLNGDSMSGVINSAIVGAGIGAVVGGVAGGFAGAGIIGPMGLATSDFWAGFNVAIGVGEGAALSSNLGALAGGVASIFTDPRKVYGSTDSPCE